MFYNPNLQKVIGSRWVLACNNDQENLSPVVSDTTLHLLMVIKTNFKVEAGQFDIETAFVYGKLEEGLWMAFPEG
jgi:hypothetical protein